MAELNIKGVRSGEAFWYAPLLDLAVPIQVDGLTIVLIGSDKYFVRHDGSRIWESEVYKTREEACHMVRQWCVERIRDCQAKIADAQIILAKLGVVYDDVPVCAEQMENALTDEEAKLPF
jgi:hypothetical protein